MISCLLSGVEPIRRAQRRELPEDRAVNIARDPTAWAWLPREQNSWEDDTAVCPLPDVRQSRSA